MSYLKGSIRKLSSNYALHVAARDITLSFKDSPILYGLTDKGKLHLATVKTDLNTRNS